MHNASHYFIDMFNYWSVKLLDTTIPIRRDNRVDCHLVAETTLDTMEVVIRYNARRLGKWSKSMVLSGIFHEIRHLQQGIHPYDTKKQKIALELDAELFAVKMMKKYYPKLAKETFKHYQQQFRKKWWRDKYPIHYAAFKNIKEYQK